MSITASKFAKSKERSKRAFIMRHNLIIEARFRGADPSTQSKLVPIRWPRKDSRLGESRAWTVLPGVKPSISRLRVQWANHYNIAPKSSQIHISYSIIAFNWHRSDHQRQIIIFFIIPWNETQTRTKWSTLRHSKALNHLPDMVPSNLFLLCTYEARNAVPGIGVYLSRGWCPISQGMVLLL